MKEVGSEKLALLRRMRLNAATAQNLIRQGVTPPARSASAQRVKSWRDLFDGLPTGIRIVGFGAVWTKVLS